MAASLAEALTVFHDDEERATRIHYLVDEAFPPEPTVRRLQQPDEAKRGVRALVPHLADAEFERRWERIVHEPPADGRQPLTAVRWRRVLQGEPQTDSRRSATRTAEP